MLVCPLVFALLSYPGQDVSELVERLRSERIDERADAARKLREAGLSAIPQLEKASADPDPEVAERARYLLRYIRLRKRITPALDKSMPGVTDRLLGTSKHPAYEVLHEAMAVEGINLVHPGLRSEDLAVVAERALEEELEPEELDEVLSLVGRKRIRSATELVLRKLKDPRAAVQSDAILALRGLHSRETIPALREVLDSRDVRLRTETLVALTDLNAPGLVPDLLRALGGSDDLAALSAGMCLDVIQDRESIPLILAKVDDPDPAHCKRVLMALGWARTPEVRARVALLLKDDRTMVRAQAAHLLGEILSRDHAPDLLALSRSGPREVRIGALEGLAALGLPETAPSLVPLLKDPDEAIRQEAVRVLGILRVSETLPEIARLVEDPKKGVRKSAFRAIGLSGFRKGADPLLRILDSPDDPDRESVALPLATLGVREAVPSLLKFLRDKDSSVRESGAWALGRLGARQAIPALRALLDDEKSGVRSEALDSLGNLFAIESYIGVTDRLADGDHLARTSAATTLCMFGMTAGIPMLLDEEYSLIYLNAVRKQAVFKRLIEERFDDDLHGTRRENFAAVARRMGMRVEFGDPEASEAWLEQVHDVPRGSPILIVLDRLTYQRFMPILEDDRVVILSRDKAFAFWTEWWRERNR